MKTSSIDVSGLINSTVNTVNNQESNESTFDFKTIIDELSMNNQYYNSASEVSNNTKVEQKITSDKNNFDDTYNNEELINNDESDINKSDFISEKVDNNSVVKDIEEQIKDVLTEKLCISDEELETVLETLGLTLVDCLDSSNLAQVIADVSGSEDTASIITDESLYSTFTDLITDMNNIQEEIISDNGISKDELNQIIEVINQQQSTVQENNTESTIIEEELTTEEELASNVSLLNNGVKNNDDVLKAADNNTETENIVSTESLTKIIKSTDSSSESNTESKNEGQLTQQLSSEDKTDELNEEGVTEINESIIHDNFKAALEENADASKVTQNQMVDTKNILEQIDSQIKLNLSNDTTKMEFQLYPEHLGKISVQLVSKDGQVTAQLTAQNLAVKEVLESQIADLKTSMINQGIKVEAVEVTVESHEFERNLDGQEDTSDKYQQSANEERKQHNYREMEDFDELSDEDILEAEIALGNGNTINYKA